MEDTGAHTHIFCYADFAALGFIFLASCHHPIPVSIRLLDGPNEHTHYNLDKNSTGVAIDTKPRLWGPYGASVLKTPNTIHRHPAAK